MHAVKIESPIDLLKPFLISMLAFSLTATTVSADDRALFQATNAKPYVFFILDISGSMADTPQRKNPASSGEDPFSRLYLAKRAAFEVIKEVGDSVHYGWSTFNREQLKVRRKHWLYKLEQNPSFYSQIPILPAGKPVIFGEPRHRKSGQVADSFGNFTYISDSSKVYKHRYCTSPTQVEDKILDFPKLGHRGDYLTTFYYYHNYRHYRVHFLPLEGNNEMGDPQIQVKVRIEERRFSCTYENYSGAYTLRYQETLNFVRFYEDDRDPSDPLPFASFTDYLSLGRSGNDTSGFNIDDYEGVSACSAPNLSDPDDPDNGRSHRWDGNYDGDREFGDVLTYDVTTDPLGRGRALSRGDMIPWDWENGHFSTSNREEILLRLAPNLAIGETVPDFRIARYFQDVPVGTPTNGRLLLKPEFVDHPPILSFGGTPIAGSLTSFRGWYDDWLQEAQDPNSGDLSLRCRQKYVILLTDGAETCESGSLSDPNSQRRRLPREAAAALYQRGIKTFVVAFGTTSTETASLVDIADEGGTGAGVDSNNDGVFESPGRDKDGDGLPDGPGPIQVSNKDDLVEALLNVFQLVQPEATSISSAAVPTVQADVDDKIFLTEFTPLDSGSVWPGSLQSFIKVLPLTADGLPDVNSKCSNDKKSSCLAWDAQKAVVEYQVKGSENDPLGFAADQRRVFYSKFRPDDGQNAFEVDERVPKQRRLLENVEAALPSQPRPPAAEDLWRGFGIDFTPGDSDSEDDAAFMAEQVIEQTLALKRATLPDGQDLEFVIGDFFHSDPLLLGSPSNTSYFVQDLEGDPDLSCEAGDAKSYRCFALFHQYRRKILYVGSNAGMVHAFDAGTYRLPPNPELADLGTFDNGTGRELFAFVPRPVMPTLVEMAVEQPNRHKFTVDGPPTAADVFIDPAHQGRDSINPPNADDREWRTVLLGGLRRGGSRMGDRSGGFGDLLDPDVVRPDVDEPQANTDLQLTSGYYLLDVTQPDVVETELILGHRNDKDLDGLVDIWVPLGVDDPAKPPACLGGADSEGGNEVGDFPSACGPVAFGSTLWEFLDLMIGGKDASGRNFPPLRLDEDNNGFVDLGFSWSKPVIGRLRVCTGVLCDPEDPLQVESGHQRDLYVAVFGGGIDPRHPNQRGNWLYMVDIETGRTIYKQPVVGSAPGRPTVVPTPDGYIDRIYLGTTQGYLYRLDMRPQVYSGEMILPRLQSMILSETAVNPNTPLEQPELVSKLVERILPTAHIENSGTSTQLFTPTLLFNINEDQPLESRALYMSASSFLVAELGKTGLAFGTGNREDLFKAVESSSQIPRPEHFVVFVDEVSSRELRDPTFQPLTLSSLQHIEGSFSGQNFLLDRPEGERGWFLDLGPEERLVGDPLVLSGVLFFSTFTPSLPSVVSNANNILCEDSGKSKVYGTLLTNGEGILATPDGEVSRNIEVSGLVTAPFAEQSQTKNPPAPGAGGFDDGTGSLSSVSPQLKRLMNELKALFPSNCTFPPGHRLDIKVRNQDTGLTFVVPVPICVVLTAFREL